MIDVSLEITINVWPNIFYTIDSLFAYNYIHLFLFNLILQKNWLQMDFGLAFVGLFSTKMFPILNSYVKQNKSHYSRIGFD